MNKLLSVAGIGLSLLALHCVGEDPPIPGYGNSVVDGGTTGDATAEAATAQSRIVGADFDAPDCLPWTKNSANATSSSELHAGKASCQVCRQPSEVVYNVYQEIRGLEPGVWTASAWVRNAPSKTGGAAYLELGVFDAAGAQVGEISANKMLLDDTWRQGTCLLYTSRCV